ncbi:MAG: hypothetical protein EHM49_03470 [Deltaproteobacteria bacterium]|nr:MAG: hypothetical protein EHM49_03470 [Deltaproteobacteria bacterium]
MNIESFVATSQQLFHMAEDGSWPSIQKHGLLSTAALLAKWEYSEKDRLAICGTHRPKSFPIDHKKYGRAILRDQKAIDPEKLRKCLVGMTEEEWYHLLNSKVFFWPDWQALKWFLQATAYFNKPHVVITIDTHRLLGKFADMITLSAINTGSTFPRRNQISPEPRGKDTFKRIQEYQLPRARELAVDDGVQDLVRFTVSVQRLIIREKDAEPEVLETLWQPNHQ